MSGLATPPHPPFGHLLPGGEKGTARAAAAWAGRRGGASRSPSPRRGEGRGEGGCAVVIAENSPLVSLHDLHHRDDRARVNAVLLPIRRGVLSDGRIDGFEDFRIGIRIKQSLIHRVTASSAAPGVSWRAPRFRPDRRHLAWPPATLGRSCGAVPARRGSLHPRND